jgi:DNA-binding CsgD family transcriptional regulator
LPRFRRAPDDDGTANMARADRERRTSLPAARLLGDMANLLKALTTRRFCAALLRQINAWVRVDHCALVRLTPGAGIQLFGAESAAAFVAKGARAIVCYIDRYHKVDPIRRALHVAHAGTDVVVRRERAVDVVDTGYRSAYYDGPGIVDRLSVATRDSGGGLVSLQLKRQCASGEFTERERETLAAVAPLLAAACTRHIELLVHAGAGPQAWRARVAAACPAMTSRELDVAASLLAGRTLRESANALGVAYSSVVTYCERAYSRLGVKNLRELRIRFAEPAHAGEPVALPAKADRTAVGL